MKHVAFLPLVAALVFGSAVASAQSHDHTHAAPTGQSPRAPAAPDHNKAFNAIDKNQDGQLSTTELAEHPMAAHAAMVDANKDGTLSRAEFKALNQM